MQPKFIFYAISLLGMSTAAPLQDRDSQRLTTQTNIKFDDISAFAPVPSDYQNLNWNGWYVSSPDRFAQPITYVKYASRYQYGRIPSGVTGILDRGAQLSSFALSSLQFGCSSAVPSDGTPPGPPTPCTVHVVRKCVGGPTQKVDAEYAPTKAVAPMKALNVAGSGACKKAHEYTFKATGKNGQVVDLLIDNIVLQEQSRT